MRREKCHLFLPSCFNCMFFPPCYRYAVSHSPNGGICVHSCPFVSIRGSNTTQATPFRVFRVNSCPFVILTLPPLLSFFVYFVFFVVNPYLWSFVSIRVHSWFLLSPLLFSCLSCVSWFDISFAIRVHSCPFVVLTLPAFFFRVFRVFRG